MNLLTTARDLKRRKARERLGLFVAEGIRGVEELTRSGLDIRGVLTSPRLRDSARGLALISELEARGLTIEQVDDRDFESAADTDSPQGVLALAVAPERRLADLLPDPDSDSGSDPGTALRLLVLDAVQDPGNVGTMLRTAAALGATATVSLPGTVDLWNAKVVRSAMGAHFHHPCVTGTWDELEAFRRKHAVAVWAADAAGESIEQLAAPARLAIVVGNEGGGLSSVSRTRADRLVALPISASIESLNVSVAAGILLYELRR